MSFRSTTLLSIGLALSGACSDPTLWIGTAHSEVAGQPATESPPWRAADGGARSTNQVDTSSPPSAAGSSATAAVMTAAASTNAGAHAAVGGSVAQRAASAAMDEDAGPPPGLGDPTRSPLVPSRLPRIEGQCPNLNGDGMYTFTAGGRSLLVQIYMRPDAKSMPAPGGPLIMYFHSLGTSASEVTNGFTQASIDQVVAQGGVVAAFNDTPCITCGLPEDVVWYDEDDVVSDQVVACAIEKAQIDTRRIHSVGFSSGALHSMHLALARSSYIASVVSYSGGMPLAVSDPQDPENKVASLLAYGREGVDNAVAADFNVGSRKWYETYAPKGYYSLLCNHGGGHMIPLDLPAHALRFLLDHPYRVQPEPYLKTVPAEFPSYCRNGPP